MTKDEIRMANQIPNSNDENRPSPKPQGANGQHCFDLEERTAIFGEKAIQVARRIPVNQITSSLISQLVRASTSVGANYTEANDAESKKDFRHLINRCRKEAKECKHWFRMIASAVPELRSETIPLWKEAKELNLIFSAIRRNSPEK